MRVFTLVVGMLAVGLGSGCTHTQLRRNTVNQARTLGDVHQQQVLNNLAMFVANQDALPHFAYPVEGQNQVTDTGGGTTAIGWVVEGFDSAELGFEASRQANQVWNLQPINDPHKLALMRCAYQLAVRGAGYGNAACGDDCARQIADFYKGHSHGSNDPTGQSGVRSLTFAPNWFCVGTKKDVPKDCCGYAGHHCGVYVWVPPHGRGELARLSLAVLDFAIYDPEEPPVRTKDVVLYLDAKGNPAKPAEASKVVTATVPLDARSDDVEPLLRGVADTKTQPSPPQLKYQTPRQKDAGTATPDLLNLRRRLGAIR